MSEISRQIKLSKQVQSIALQTVKQVQAIDPSDSETIYVARAFVREIVWQLIDKFEALEAEIVDELRLTLSEVARTGGVGGGLCEPS